MGLNCRNVQERGNINVIKNITSNR